MRKPDPAARGGDAGEAVRFMLLKAAIFILLPLISAVVVAIVVLQ
ncbi:MAG: phosphoribosylformylglycinamidine synthase-associated small membrane protein [Filomicrobium sp.]|jgi:hypothetical protein